MSIGSAQDGIARPGPIGRWWRIGNGVGTLAIAGWIALNAPTFVRETPPSALGGAAIAFATAAALSNLPALASAGFGRAWGWWPVGVTVAALATLGGVGWAATGAWWNPALGLGALVLMEAVFIHLGVSYLLAGVLGVPG